MTVAALECAALQRCSFLLSIKVRTPCTGHSVREDFFLLFLLACLCELHRIRIVQAEMGLAGSRTSFSFPLDRKPSFLSVIFCICHYVCPLVHPILPVTAFGWQFLTVAACSWSRFFFWVFCKLCRSLGRHSPHDMRRVAGDCTPGNSVQNENGTEIGEAHYGNVDS